MWFNISALQDVLQIFQPFFSKNIDNYCYFLAE